MGKPLRGRARRVAAAARPVKEPSGRSHMFGSLRVPFVI